MPLHRQVADERKREEVTVNAMLAMSETSVVRRYGMPEGMIAPDVAARRGLPPLTGGVTA